MSYATTWDLEPLFPPPASSEFQLIMGAYRESLQGLATEAPKLPALSSDTSVTDTWVAFLRQLEQVEALGADLGSFLGCCAAGDASNKQYRQLEAAMSALQPLREQIYIEVEYGLRSVDDAVFNGLMQQHDWLDQNEFFLRLRRQNAAMRLPKPEEQLASELAVDGIDAWGRLYDRLSSDLRVTVMENGELVQKSPGQIRFDSPERTVRQNNFYAAEKAWKTIADSCADALNHLSGTRLTLYRRLKLQDHLAMPLHRNRMTRETLNALWDAVTARKSMLLPVLQKKAEMLGVDRLAVYDISAPLPRSPRDGGAAKISFDDGANLVVRAFSSFSPEMGQFAQQSFDERWVESENRGGKRQGAFCTGFLKRKQSRIFMTFTESYDNVSTLAHELGHAYHSWILKDEPIFLQDYPMNLAETASTFAEAVLAEERLKHSQSNAEKLSILSDMVSDAVVYLMNIHSRFLFEDEFHRERHAGELTPARFSELMLAAQKEAYLDALAPDGWAPDFWVSKLHFYISGLPFYNFPYTFGYLLSTGMFALADEFGTDFPDRFRQFLIATGCAKTEDAVLSTFGYDLRQPDFWNKSLDVVERRAQQFVQMVDRA